MLLRYDVNFTDYTDNDPSFEGRRIISQDLELQYRSRKPEVDLMNLTVAA